MGQMIKCYNGQEIHLEEIFIKQFRIHPEFLMKEIRTWSNYQGRPDKTYQLIYESSDDPYQIQSDQEQIIHIANQIHKHLSFPDHEEDTIYLALTPGEDNLSKNIYVFSLNMHDLLIINSWSQEYLDLIPEKVKNFELLW